MNNKTDFRNLVKTADRSFSGWDFSFITETGRMHSNPLDWSYGSMALGLMNKSESLLDMGTGGGEFLSMLRPFPPSISATEAYEPNIPLAKTKLEPLGVKVVGIKEDSDLPFGSYQFDTVLNKHEAYSVQEVKRILSPGGVFLTQQVGGGDCLEINQALGAKVSDEYQHWKLDFAVGELEEAGFKILFSSEQFPVQRFYDIGALIYYLKAIPWQVENFSAERYIDELYTVHQMIESKGFFEVNQHRFIIKAQVNGIPES